MRRFLASALLLLGLVSTVGLVGCDDAASKPAGAPAAGAPAGGAPAGGAPDKPADPAK